MTTTRFLLAALAAVLIHPSALAQATSAASSPSATATAADAGCAKFAARHQHGADRNTPQSASMSGSCAPARAASSAKKASRHDHKDYK